MDESVGAQAASGTLSLIELRRHLLRRASSLAVRARAHRSRGDLNTAVRLEEQAARIARVARDMGRGQ